MNNLLTMIGWILLITFFIFIFDPQLLGLNVATVINTFLANLGAF